MFKSKESENEVVWKVRLMDKVDTLGIEFRLIKFLIVMVCLFKFVNMLLNCTRRVQCCNEKGLKMNLHVTFLSKYLHQISH